MTGFGFPIKRGILAFVLWFRVRGTAITVTRFTSVDLEQSGVGAGEDTWPTFKLFFKNIIGFADGLEMAKRQREKARMTLGFWFYS